MDNLFPKPPRKGLFVYTICLLSLCSIIKAQPNFLSIDCPYATLTTTSTYAPNSTYQTNLNTLLSVLSSNSNNSNGFYNFTVGSPPDVAYGLFLCRGDFSVADCQDCVVSALRSVVERCPWSKQVTIWYDPYCMIRYSNESFFSSPDLRFQKILINPKSVTNVTLFTQVLGQVMDDIATWASSDDSGKKFATAASTYSPLQPVYGLGQCTPDLFDFDCKDCLRRAISILPYCCNANLGARVLFPSCYVHYETYPFYNDSVRAAPPPTTNNPPSSPGKMITIVVSVSASVVLALLGSGIYYQRRRKRTAEEEKENSQEVQLLDLAQGRIVDDYSTENLQGERPTKSHNFPSVQLDLILVATKNFSQENKLGEGGFGPVYKGTLPDGKEIAVKRLSTNSGQGLQEFKNEITLIARLQHRNLVRLLGCCLEGNELMLIYEYMPNKSLDFFLFVDIWLQSTPWKDCFLLNLMSSVLEFSY